MGISDMELLISDTFSQYPLSIPPLLLQISKSSRYNAQHKKQCFTFVSFKRSKLNAKRYITSGSTPSTFPVRPFNSFSAFFLIRRVISFQCTNYHSNCKRQTGHIPSQQVSTLTLKLEGQCLFF